MPTSTIELQSTINAASIFLRSMPLASVGGYSNEPALTIANSVLSLVLAPPLAWPWNRGTFTSPALVVGTQNFTANIPTFGWLETASISVGGKTYELAIKNKLSEESNQQRPGFIAVQSTDGTGNWTFRLFPSPDQAYTVTLNYQQTAPLFTSLTQTWSPIPDTLSALYTLGFRAFCYEYLADPRWINTLQLFLSQLVGTNGGLDDAQANLFLWNKLRDTREEVEAGEAQRTTRRRQ